MKFRIKKLIIVVLLNVLVVITYPAICSYPIGFSGLNKVGSATINSLILLNVFLIFYNFLLKKKTNAKFLLTTTNIIIGIFSVIYLFVTLSVPLSNPFGVLSLSLKLGGNKSEIRSVCSADLGDNRYLEVIQNENDGEYECFVIRKKLFAFRHDSQGHNYNWDNNEINSQSVGFINDICKISSNDEDALIVYCALSDDVDKAYIDGKEMNVLTDGTIRLAYYVIEGQSDTGHIVKYVLTKANENNEVIYYTKMSA